MGLIDTGVFKAALRGPHLDLTPVPYLDSTLACELWLQSLPTPRPPARCDPLRKGTL
jgi:hypothetical protein